MTHPDTPYSESELLQQCAAGNGKAFARLFDRYSGKVMHTAFTITRSQSLSEDIVQDVFMKMWNKRAELTEVDSFENWLFVVTRNFCVTALTKISRLGVKHAELANHLPEFEPAGEPGQLKSLQAEVLQVMQVLPEQQRRVFELAKLRGMTREEIAAELGISPNTVKMHLVLAVRTMRARLRHRLDLVLMLTILKNFF